MSVTDRVLTTEEIDDLFVTAVEGGINYWAIIQNKDYDNSVAKIWDFEKSQEINRDVIVRGYEKFLEQGFLEKNYEGEFTVEDWLENAPDATDCDIIVQLGLYGEIVFS